MLSKSEEWRVLVQVRERLIYLNCQNLDELDAGVVHHEDSSQLTQMIKLIVDYVGLLNAHQAKKLNREFPSSNHISYMTWVVEGIINQDHPWQNWKPR